MWASSHFEPRTGSMDCFDKQGGDTVFGAGIPAQTIKPSVSVG